MSQRKTKKQVETLAWITDDEAEFWTSITPTKKPKSSESDPNLSKLKTNSFETDLPDGDHFKFNNTSDKQPETDLFSQQENQQKTDQLLNGENQNEFKQDDALPQTKEKRSKTSEQLAEALEKRSKQTNNKRSKQTDEFNGTHDKHTNKTKQEAFRNQDRLHSKSVDIPKTNLTFIEELRQELTEIAETKNNDLGGKEEDYLEIDSNGKIKTNNKITNDINVEKKTKINDDLPIKEKIKSFVDDGKVKEKVQSFVGELTEETFVIRGTLDEETLLNRRSRRAKDLIPFFQQNKRLVHQNTL